MDGCKQDFFYVSDVKDMSNFAKTKWNFEHQFLRFWRALCQRLASARRFWQQLLIALPVCAGCKFTSSNVRARSVPGPEGMSNFLPAMSKPCRIFGRHGHFSTLAAINDVKKCTKMPNFGRWKTLVASNWAARTAQSTPPPCAILLADDDAPPEDEDEEEEAGGGEEDVAELEQAVHQGATLAVANGAGPSGSRG
jgi:hypothetical protein